MTAEEKLVEQLEQLCDAVDRAPVVKSRGSDGYGRTLDALEDGWPGRVGPIRSTVKQIRAALLDYEHEKRMAGR